MIVVSRFRATGVIFAGSVVVTDLAIETVVNNFDDRDRCTKEGRHLDCALVQKTVFCDQRGERCGVGLVKGMGVPNVPFEIVCRDANPTTNAYGNMKLRVDSEPERVEERIVG